MHRPNFAPLGVECVKDLFHTLREDQVESVLTLAERTLGFSDGMDVLSTYIHLPPENFVTSHIGKSIKALNTFIRHGDVTGENIDEADLLRIHDFFFQVHHRMSDIIQNGHRTRFSNSFLQLMQEYPGIAGQQKDCIVDMLSTEHSISAITTTLDVAENSMDSTDACIVLTVLTRPNMGDFASMYIDNTLLVMDRIMAQIKQKEGVQQLPIQMKDYVTLFFTTIQNQIPRLKRDGYLPYFQIGIHALLQHHPELTNWGISEHIFNADPYPEYHYARLSPEQRKIEGTDELTPPIALVKSNGYEQLQSLHGLIQRIPEKTQELTKRLQEFFQDPEIGLVRKRLFGELFLHDNSNQVNIPLVMKQFGLTAEQVQKVFNHELIYSLMDMMLDSPEKYGFQLGFLLAETSFYSLPENLAQKLQAKASTGECSLKPYHGQWYLCSLSEERMEEAVNNGLTILVDGFMLVKFIGKPCGMCMETTATPEGRVFLAKHWYSLGLEFHQQLKDAFQQKKTSISIPAAQWVYMRPVAQKQFGKDFGDRLYEKAKHAIPSTVEIGKNRIKKKSRKKWISELEPFE